MPTVLVTGATGNIGRELVHLLSLDPRVGEIRIATRDPDSAAAQLLVAMDPALIRPVKLSLDPDDLARAFYDGVNRVCLITPLSDDMVGWQKAALGAARGVSRIVKISQDQQRRRAPDIRRRGRGHAARRALGGRRDAARHGRGERDPAPDHVHAALSDRARALPERR